MFDEEMKKEQEMVYETLIDNGYSEDMASSVVSQYEYDFYPDCKDIGDIARQIFIDNAYIVEEELEIRDYITVDWIGLAHLLQSNRDMFISKDGHGIVVE